MTSKTSFFNKGIYKSTLKRYMWGSVLYFVLLFMSTCLIFIMNSNSQFGTQDNHLIMTEQYLTFPLLLTVVVPTVTALLIFRFIHSKKQSIFIHSLPVSRTANYISSLASGLTLMLAPVIANGLILMLISVCSGQEFFSAADCVLWIAINSMALFMMFSCSVISANLTGNSFAMIVINILIHSFLFITVAALSTMASAFLYGYAQNNDIFGFIADNNFAFAVMSRTNGYFVRFFPLWETIKYVAASIALYILAYLLYKKRRVENSGNVAGYKCLNHIFKYIVTFFVSMIGFAIFYMSIERHPLIFAVIIAIISASAYAASEMVLKKTMNVWYAWKGYVGFACFFAVLIALFSATSFFGYETRVPAEEEIKQAAIYNYYYGESEPFTASKAAIKKITEVHKGFADKEDIPAFSASNLHEATTNIHIVYKLSNGKTLSRQYEIKDKECIALMNEMYEYEDIKKASENVFNDDFNILSIYITDSGKNIKDIDGFVNALRADTLALGYEELRGAEGNEKSYYCSINISYVSKKKVNGQSRMYDDFVRITDKYENTVKWLKENMNTK